jgi:hypothetical protein
MGELAHGYVAPSFSYMRWDDNDYPLQPRVNVSRLLNVRGDIHGYLFHDACWRLCQEAVKPHDIPLDQLFRICKSLPMPRDAAGFCWGHDHGGLNIFDDRNHYPWEDRYLKFNTSLRYANSNPYSIPKITGLLRMSSLKSRASPRKSRIYAPCSNSKNYLSILPWEIFELIAINLSTRDASSLSRSSKAFLPLLTSQNFWESRFKSGHDRHFIFETRNSKQPRDWITLYRVTSCAQSPPGLRNRKRIWRSIQVLTKLLYLRLDDTLGFSLGIQKTNSSKWKNVSADIIDGTVYVFRDGCWIFRKQSTSIPTDLARITFSFTSDGDSGYLAGIHLIPNHGANIRLGYIIEGSELYCNVTTIKGFILAVGSRGIRALQIVSSDGRTSRWFGSHRNSPVTERLVDTESIRALEVGVDVSLAIIFVY